MEPKDYWAAVRLGWKQICACLIAALIVGGLFAWTQSSSQESTNTAIRKLYIASSAPAVGTEGPIASYAELAGGTLVRERVSEEVGYDVAAGTITVTVITAKVLQLTATDASRDRAEEIADTYVEVLPAMIDQVGDASEPVELTIISSATEELVPVSGSRRIVLLAGLLGLGGGLAWAFSRHAARLGRASRTDAS